MLERASDPFYSGSVGFPSVRSGNTRRVDYNPTKVGPQHFSKGSIGGIVGQRSGPNIFKPIGSSLESALTVGKSITLGRNHELENETTAHNTSLAQQSMDLGGPSIESTIMQGLKHGSFGTSVLNSTNINSPKPLIPRIGGQRNVMF
jgi:hypothetical protein